MIDARLYDPAKVDVPGLVARGIKAAGTQKELAERIGVTPRFLQLLAKDQNRKMRYSDYVFTLMIADGWGEDIDARLYEPAKVDVLRLLARGVQAAGTQKELAERIGVTPRFLQLLAKDQDKTMRYSDYVLITMVADGWE